MPNAMTALSQVRLSSVMRKVDKKATPENLHNKRQKKARMTIAHANRSPAIARKPTYRHAP
jgi:hypothetical protein